MSVEGQESQVTNQSLEVSVVIPCLNEADTLGTCVKKALQCMAEHGIRGEVVVADNGSTDGSVEIAERSGARVVRVAEKGYGAALQAGISSAQAPFVVMGDADDSYDFSEVHKFVEKLRNGHDLVMGCRLPGGGGKIVPGAMPFTHRYFGNPMFTALAKIFFRSRVNDVYCGLRGFTKVFYESLGLRCTGMEFATEMIIKACLFSKNVAEIPITLHRDGRIAHPPHLSTVRDGLKTLRFFLIFSPRWLFVYPGLFLMIIGALGFALLLPGTLRIGEHVFMDVQSMFASGVALTVGYQLVIFAVLARFFAESEGLMPASVSLAKINKVITVNSGVFVGLGVMLAGILLYALAFSLWAKNDFGRMNLSESLRMTIPGGLLAVLGVQTVFSSLFMSILGLKRRT